MNHKRFSRVQRTLTFVAIMNHKTFSRVQRTHTVIELLQNKPIFKNYKRVSPLDSWMRCYRVEYLQTCESAGLLDAMIIMLDFYKRMSPLDSWM